MNSIRLAFTYPENKGRYRRFGFGAPSRDHTYKTEGSSQTVICCVFRFGGLLVEEVLVLRSLAKDWMAFVDGWLLAAQHTPSLVMMLQLNQQSISQQCMAHMALLAFRCDLTPSTLVRALSTPLHGTHCIELFEQQKTMLCQILSAKHNEHLERILKVVAPHIHTFSKILGPVLSAPSHHSYRVFVMVMVVVIDIQKYPFVYYIC